MNLSRTDNFTFRVNELERRLIADVAQQLERGESDMLRMLVRREAERLGIISTAVQGTQFIQPSILGHNTEARS